MDFDLRQGVPVLRVAPPSGEVSRKYWLSPEERRAVVRENMRRGNFHLLVERGREANRTSTK